MPFVAGTPGRSPVTYPTDKGFVTYNPRTRTYSGPGRKPKGAKVAPVDPSPPTVTVTSDGNVTTTGFNSRAAAKRARSRARASRRKTRAILRSFDRDRQTASEPAGPKLTSRPYTNDPAKAVISSLPSPASKPLTFEGKKTAGTPTLSSLRESAKTGTLHVNRKGYLTTPAIRTASRELRRAKRAAPKATHDVGGIEDPEIRKAIVRYAPRVDKLAREQYGISGEALLSKLVKGESNEEQGAVSSAAAKSITQFIPSTREDFVNRLGVDPWASKDSAVKAATMHLDGKHGYSPGLEGYNPGGGEAYVRYILDQPVGAPTRAGRRVTARIRRAQEQARRLGLAAGAAPRRRGGVAGPGRIPSVVYIGKQAEKRFGLHVSENPAFDTVDPVHVEGSYHYREDSKGRGEAIDVSGDAAAMLEFDRWVAKRWGQGVTELFYDPGISIKEGQEIGGIGGHSDHVHVAVAMPGERFGGGIAPGAVAGSGGAVFVGYGGTAAAAASSSRRAAHAAAKGRGRTQSPYASAWGKLRRLERLGAGIGTGTDSRGAQTDNSVLEELERKYGKAVV
jgi:hypothetical protein